MSAARRALPWALLVVLGLVTINAAQLGAHFESQIKTPARTHPAGTHPRTTAVGAPTTGFGGYAQITPFTPFHEISAAWTVPTIVKTSPSGDASTWIGAQTPGGGFIQVGIVEDSPRETKGEPPIRLYEAFWSDPAVTFHPQNLGMVGPGDHVSASMTETKSGWKLRLTDVETRLHAARTVTYGPRGGYVVAEWIQEDPSYGPPPLHNESYPWTSTVRFTTLEVDGKPPDLVYSESQALSSPNGVYLVPSPVSNDSFTIAPATGVQAQYMSDVAAFNDAVYHMNYAYSALRSPGAEHAAVRSLQTAVSRFIQELSTQRWPTTATTLVHQLLAQERRLPGALHKLAAAPPKQVPKALAHFLELDNSGHDVADNLRAAIHLPPA